MSQKMFKIIYLGLDNAGKTSFLLSLENKYSELYSLKPTKGLYKFEQNILGFSIHLFDFGGQKIYRDEFFKKPENYLSTDLLFYLIDIQDRRRFAENGEFFEKLLKEFEKNDVKPKIIICLHKCDPDLLADPDSYIHGTIQIAERLFKSKANGRELDFFQTSVFDYSSLTRAFSAGLLKIFKDFKKVMETIFTDFISKTKANGVCLLNENALILADLYDETKETRDIIEIIGANMAQMSQRLIQYDYGHPDSIEIKMRGWSFFKTFELGEKEIKAGAKKRFYLIIYSKNPDNFEKINELLPNFTLTVSNTLKNFLKD
ncbi:MAG: hypothetical protein HWN67_09625 [Candidatus Helarchaeota archaeon]|nr:hypothetical protein [Candidatus Helarchaeota archaeon]